MLSINNYHHHSFINEAGPRVQADIVRVQQELHRLTTAIFERRQIEMEAICSEACRLNNVSISFNRELQQIPNQKEFDALVESIAPNRFKKYKRLEKLALETKRRIEAKYASISSLSDAKQGLAVLRRLLLRMIKILTIALRDAENIHELVEQFPETIQKTKEVLNKFKNRI